MSDTFDVACGRVGGRMEGAARWLVERCGQLGVRIYYASDAEGRFGRLVILISELSFVIAMLKTKHPEFGRWLEDVVARTTAAVASGRS